MISARCRRRLLATYLTDKNAWTILYVIWYFRLKFPDIIPYFDADLQHGVFMQRISLACVFLVVSGVVGMTTAEAFALPRVGVALPNPELSPLLTDDDGSGYDYNGIAKLNNCSGSLIRYETSKNSDKAMILTNGHCVSRPNGGFIQPNQYIANESSSRSFRFLKPNGDIGSGSVAATKILYATMTGSDMAIYQLALSFEEIASTYHVDALVLSSEHPILNDPIEILSGYWQTGYSCYIDQFIFKMKEDAYSWNDSVRYSEDGCHTKHGTSGSPVISKTSGKVIAINNTGNDDGGRCTMNNPCEISETGDVSFKKGLSYAQQTYPVYSCLNADGVLNLAKPGCALFH